MNDRTPRRHFEDDSWPPIRARGEYSPPDDEPPTRAVTEPTPYRVALIPAVHWVCPKTAPTPCHECGVPIAHRYELLWSRDVPKCPWHNVPMVRATV